MLSMEACPPNNPSGKKASLPTGRLALQFFNSYFGKGFE
jgi:hypothetical protein